MAKSLQENMAQQLCESIERLRRHVDKVEFWASAVSGLSTPVPRYEPEMTHLERYLKPSRPARKRHRRKITKRTGTAKPAANSNNAPDEAGAEAMERMAARGREDH